MFTEQGYKKLERIYEMVWECRSNIECLIDDLGNGDVHSVDPDDLFGIGRALDRIQQCCSEAYSIEETCWDELEDE